MEDSQIMHDVIIIGAGSAGLSAAIYTTRKQLNTLIVSPEVGGQTNLTNDIENYPGVKALPGPKLMEIMRDQAEGFGTRIVTNKVMKIEPKKDKTFELTLEDGSKESAKAVILAFGVLPKPLNIPGEKKFFGRGVSTCATCDALFFKNKTTAVIGGGNAALEAALELSPLCKKVYLVHRRDTFRGDEITVAKVKGLKNIELVLDSAPQEVKGDKVVKSLLVKDVKTGKETDIPLDGVFVEIGHMIDSSMVKGLVDMNDHGEVIVDNRQNTSVRGVFAAGDCTPTPFKQSVIAAGQGAIAALECHKYLTGGKSTGSDWSASDKKPL